MNNDIIRMAREAWGEHHEIFWFDDGGIERFAALVAAAEREACARVCDSFGMKGSAAVDCAVAIRDRSKE